MKVRYELRVYVEDELVFNTEAPTFDMIEERLPRADRALDDFIGTLGIAKLSRCCNAEITVYGICMDCGEPA